MALENNAICSICGKPYHVCRTCQDVKSFTPWRSVTDTMEHYKIYLIVADYTNNKDKAKAKSELENCNLSDLEILVPSIKSVIKEIMAEEKIVEKPVRVQKLNRMNTKDDIE